MQGPHHTSVQWAHIRVARRRSTRPQRSQPGWGEWVLRGGEALRDRGSGQPRRVFVARFAAEMPHVQARPGACLLRSQGTQARPLCPPLKASCRSAPHTPHGPVTQSPHTGLAHRLQLNCSSAHLPHVSHSGGVAGLCFQVRSSSLLVVPCSARHSMQCRSQCASLRPVAHPAA